MNNDVERLTRFLMMVCAAPTCACNMEASFHVNPREKISMATRVEPRISRVTRRESNRGHDAGAAGAALLA